MKDFNYARFFELAIDLTAQKDLGALFGRIVNEAMDLTASDAGTLYILEGERLQFHYMITRSMNVDKCAERGEIDIPPVPLGRQHICAVSAIEKRLINVANVYESDEYDFSGAKNYDRMTGYHTGSMLVVPMLDDDEDCIGVLQLINPMDGKSILKYTAEDEWVIRALSSFAAISLNNRRKSIEIRELLDSFVRVMVNAVDTRSPYNANHTRKMVQYAERFLKWAEDTGADFAIGSKDVDPFLMSVWLHDIGKLLIPLEIMDKPTRLGAGLDRVLDRITIAILMEKLQGSEKNIQILEDARKEILDINSLGFLTDEKEAVLKKISGISYTDENGEVRPLLTKEEKEALGIKKGTLTAAERKAIEDHVVYTARMLSDMSFKGRYMRVPAIAGGHHEFLDGSGYPDRKKDGDIPIETRLLTILDVYDALTAEDRPYKPPMPPQKAFSILEDMAKEGKLDMNILLLFKQSRVWEKE